MLKGYYLLLIAFDQVTLPDLIKQKRNQITISSWKLSHEPKSVSHTNCKFG